MPLESQWWNLWAAQQTTKKLFGVEPAVYGAQEQRVPPAACPAGSSTWGSSTRCSSVSDGALIPTLRSTAVNWPGPDGKCDRRLHPRAAARRTTRTRSSTSSTTCTRRTSYDAARRSRSSTRASRPFDSYDDLLALDELAPVFGEFTNLSRYFTDATSGDYIGVQPADEFFGDYLDDRVTNQQRPGRGRRVPAPAAAAPPARFGVHAGRAAPRGHAQPRPRMTKPLGEAGERN